MFQTVDSKSGLKKWTRVTSKGCGKGGGFYFGGSGPLERVATPYINTYNTLLQYATCVKNLADKNFRLSFYAI